MNQAAGKYAFCFVSMKERRNDTCIFKNNFSYDSLTIFDGDSSGSSMLGKYCGLTLPPNLVSSTNNIFIHFKSGGAYTRNGFHLQYNLNYGDLNCDAHMEVIGNGVCNDEANNEGCIYDGGDCCLPNTNSDQCTECICHHQETCATGFNHPLVRDGHCQDETNNFDCNYDGGDCCGSCSVNPEHCTECICHEGGEPMVDLSCK